MFKFVIQFLILFLLWWNNRRAKGGAWFTSSSVLLGLYMICSLMGVFELQRGDYYQPYDSYYWWPMLEFDLFLLLFLLPFRQFNETRITELHLPSRAFLDVFSTIIILLSFFSIAFFAGSVRNIFSLGNLGDARNSMVEGELYFESGTAATLASVAAANYVFAIVLFFIYMIIGGSRLRCVLLLLASFSEPIHVLAFVGRDGIVFWIFTFVFCYAFFRPYLQKTDQKKILRSFFSLGGLMIVPFFLISMSRFGESSRGTIGSFVSYLGHAFLQGPLFFGMDEKPLNIGSAFPLFYEITGISRTSTGGPMVIGDWYSWKFSTFIVSLYKSLNLGGLITLGIVALVLFRITTGRAKEKINFGQFTIYLLYFQVISEGVFYFRHYTRGGNLFIVSTIIFSIVFSLVTNGSENSIVLYKVSDSEELE